MDFKTAYREERLKTQSIILKIAFHGWMNIFKRFIIKRTRIYIQAINDKIYTEIQNLKFSKENLIKIPNGICKKSYLEITKSARDETHFAYVGRLIKSKNLRFLIRTFAKYLSIYPSDKLILFGQGPEEKYLSKFINENNLANNIILWGFEEDKKKIYSNIDVLIHPSFGEGVPMNILEANLTETFVIASNVSGNRELIEHKISGLIFDPFNESDLLNQILFFKEHPGLIPTILKIAKNKVALNNDSDLIAMKIYRFLKSKLGESTNRYDKSFKNDFR